VTGERGGADLLKPDSFSFPLERSYDLSTGIISTVGVRCVMFSEATQTREILRNTRTFCCIFLQCTFPGFSLPLVLIIAIIPNEEMEKLKETVHLGVLGIYGRIIKIMIKQYGVKTWIGCSCLRLNSNGGLL
jgi:hypothetical protein